MTWEDFIEEQKQKDYFIQLEQKLEREEIFEVIYPEKEDRFKVFELTPLSEIKVVILGQDPYPNPYQAMGLAFSVPTDIEIPPSLKNIFTEIENDLGIEHWKNGNLTRWAKQGVFLLNSVLTVRAGESNSHKSYGWEFFTDSAINLISKECENVVFLLWGDLARKKKSLIKKSSHLILEASHPSPLSCYRSFIGCKHFSQTNDFLMEHGKKPINWE